MKYRTCGKRGRCVCGGRPCQAIVTYSLHIYLSVSSLLLAVIFSEINSKAVATTLLLLQYIISLWSLLLAAHRSPGLSQKKDKFPSKKNEVQFHQTVRGQQFRLKWCTTCKAVKGLRTFHCRVCDRCVHSHGECGSQLILDHHCDWLNNCIGLRNRRAFCTFIISTFTLSLTGFGLSIATVVLVSREGNSFSALQIMKKIQFSILIINTVLLFAALLFLGLLMARYVVVIGRGLTTNQFLRNIYRKDNMRNPFNQGSTCLNWLAFFAEPTIKQQRRRTEPSQPAPSDFSHCYAQTQNAKRPKRGHSKAIIRLKTEPQNIEESSGRSSSLHQQPSTPNRFLRASAAPKPHPCVCCLNKLEFESEITCDNRNRERSHILEAFSQRLCSHNQRSVKLAEQEKEQPVSSAPSDRSVQRGASPSQGLVSTSFNSPKPVAPPIVPSMHASSPSISPQFSYMQDPVPRRTLEDESLPSERKELLKPPGVPMKSH